MLLCALGALHEGVGNGGLYRRILLGRLHNLLSRYIIRRQLTLELLLILKVLPQHLLVRQSALDVLNLAVNLQILLVEFMGFVDAILEI